MKLFALQYRPLLDSSATLSEVDRFIEFCLEVKRWTYNGENFISLMWPITVFVNFDVFKIVRKSVMSILPYKGCWRKLPL